MPNYKALLEEKDNYFQPGVEPKPVQAPTGGWDAISPLSDMEPKYAVTLQNWFPRPGWVEMRGGYNIWVSCSVSSVTSLMVYRPAAPPAGSITTSVAEKMFATCGAAGGIGLLYDVSTAGVTTVVKKGISNLSILNTNFQYCNFNVPGGSSYLVACNGSQKPLFYDGSNWTTQTITGTIGSFSLTQANLISVISHQQRLWFVEKNSTRVWYLPTQSISGVANVVDVGSFCNRGGYVLNISVFTLDGGNGPNAMLLIMTNRGQAVIYSGVDPTNVATWTLVGVFDLPTPIGIRCMAKIGSDVALVTTSGLIPVSKALPFNPAAQRETAFTMRIQNAFLQAAQNYSANFGWEIALYPNQTMMLINVPTGQGQATQYAMNTLTGAWCSFTGWNAQCFERYNDNLYFGDNAGNVNIAYTGRTDLANAIQADMKCAFNYFSTPGQVKNMTMAKPYIVADGTITPTMGVDIDFGSSNITAPISTSSALGGLWGTAVWDTSVWGGGSVVIANWYSVNALGTALALRMKINYGGQGNNVVTSVGLFDTGVFDSAVFDGTGVLTPSTNLPVLQVTAFETLQEPGGPV